MSAVSRWLLVSMGVGASIVATAGDARALGPVDVEVAAEVGAGTDPGGAPTNPLGTGVGGRAGVTFERFYVGAEFFYYFGHHGEAEICPGCLYLTGGPPPPTTPVYDRALMYGVDTGYRIVKLGPFALRARLGLGNYTVTMTSGFWPVTKASSLYELRVLFDPLRVLAPNEDARVPAMRAYPREFSRGAGLLQNLSKLRSIPGDWRRQDRRPKVKRNVAFKNSIPS